MRIRAVTLPARDVAEVADAYRALGFPVEAGPDEAEVAVGRTRLRFTADRVFSGAHHLAMTIPTGVFAAAVGWLRERAELITPDGREVFEGPGTWDSRSVYFRGPDAQVLELIERRALISDGREPHPFDASRIVGVSEVGVVVDDVPAAVRALARAGLASYGGVATDGFAAVGDVHGLLILVARGRAWAPEGLQVAAEVRVVVDAGLGREVALGRRARLL
jgi:catechol 2,3-dioxygenase-like lactoylglutathione lyase family enzyme